MRRFAQAGRVFYWEEPIFEDSEAHLQFSVCSITGVNVITPVLPERLEAKQIVDLQQKLLHRVSAAGTVSRLHRLVLHSHGC